jgi:molecular chaperone GrpE
VKLDNELDNPQAEAVDPAAEKAAAGAESAETAPNAELDQLRGERDELRDLLLRRQAEFDNFRKRTERERSEFAQFAGMELIRELLPVLDDFERALKADSASPDYAKGVEMIYSRMAETMKKAGLEPIEAVGKAFDPHLHQAIERVESSDAADNTVLGEFQRGYNYKGRLLRPSMVKVAVKP